MINKKYSLYETRKLPQSWLLEQTSKDKAGWFCRQLCCDYCPCQTACSVLQGSDLHNSYTHGDMNS